MGGFRVFGRCGDERLDSEAAGCESAQRGAGPLRHTNPFCMEPKMLRGTRIMQGNEAQQYVKTIDTFRRVVHLTGL